MLHSFPHVLSPDYIQTQYVVFFKFPSFADRLLGEVASEEEGGGRSSSENADV